MTQNARSAIRHLRAYLRSPSRRDFMVGLLQSAVAIPLAGFLGHLSVSATDRREAVSKELDNLDSLMLARGPVAAAVRDEIRTRAGAVAAALAFEKFQDVPDRYLLVRARELLRDTGTEGTLSGRDMRLVFEHAGAAVCFFEEIHDFPNLGRVLIALGNTYRLVEDQRRAGQKFLWALHILKEKCDPDDLTVARLLHQVRFWRLRCVGQDLGRPQIRSEIAELTRLARQVNDPRMWVEHYREEAGFSSYLLGEPDLALERLRDLDDARSRLTEHTSYADPTLLTPKIELLFESGRNEEAIELIKDQYLPQYLQHRHVYYHRQLSAWRADHLFDTGNQIPPPEYASAFLSYLPRHRHELV